MQFKTDAMGGYVAENHCAYMVLAPWIFRWINQYQDVRKKSWIQELKIKQLVKWTRKDMFAYLQLRGITMASKALKSELIDMVR